MLRVLIVDDAACSRAMLKEIFLRADFEVVGEAGDGKEAIAKFQQLLPDLVTMDLTMPIMGGIESVKHIMAIDSSAKIIIMSAAAGQKELLLEAIRAGARDFVVKPFNKDKVLKVVEKVIRE